MFLPSFSAFAADTPIGFEADNVIVNQSDGSLLATGNVELKQANNTLRADEVTYYRHQNRSIARGNVIHTDEAGATTRATMMELDTEFTHIIAETIIAQFSNGDWIAADKVDRTAGEKATFDNSRYTPCKCDFVNGERPLWDIKASQTVRNEKTQTITHFNMRMTVMNVPVGYLPSLSHPDSSVRRRSGFLTPSFVISSDLGLTPAIPYYKVLNDTSDAEITGYRYQYRGAGVKTKYRKLWNNESLYAELYTANVETYKKNRELVGAIDTRFSSKIGNNWVVNARLRRASQDTFMRRYKFNSDTSLQSNIIATRTIANRYYLVEASDRQSLDSANKRQKETTVLPYVFYEKEKKGWRRNQRFRTELSALQLDNDEGHDLARWSGVFELSEEFQLPLGTGNYKGNATGNYYTLHSKPSISNTSLGDHSFITPALSIGWRLPIALTSVYRTAILEPQAQLAFVGGSDHTLKIPNRDSNEYRIDEANLFLLNRYQGKDYVLPGTRADIGVSATTKDKILGDTAGFFGVSRRLSGKVSTGLNAGQGGKFSDYVASLSIEPSNKLKIRWSGRLSSNDLTLNESQTSVLSGLGTGNVSFTHNQIGKAYFSTSDDDREEFSASYTQPISGGWTFSTTQLWDLSFGKTVQKKRTAQLSWNGGIQNCIYATLKYEHDPVSDRDIDATEQLNLVIGFKNLGDLKDFALTSLLPAN